jgi:aerobic-type carbon monoxide dehydrogenase small subunit (CoxS/CutS family)
LQLRGAADLDVSGPDLLGEFSLIDEESAGARHVTPHDNDFVVLRVNGREYSAAVPARRTLLDLLRNDLDLTGTKQVCDMGHCGACTVLRNGAPILSCLTLAVACQGDEITTIEGIGGPGGELSALQQAFIDCDALQCGFCTPGQIMSATALLRDNPRPTDDEIRQGMSGNLCRCGAYSGIFDAVKQAAGSPQE